jgi:4-alpha-glucanotransferase
MGNRRNSGVLLHISSLPSEYGVGDLGIEAYNFIEALAASGSKIWQILPLGPNGPGNSPYQAYSAYAGDPILISPQKLVDWGLLTNHDLANRPPFDDQKVSFETVTAWKNNIHRKAWQNFILKADLSFKQEYEAFLNEHNWWLSDYALYAACRHNYGGKSWNCWPKAVIQREAAELEKLKWELNKEYEFERFQQFLFFRQWFQLKNFANAKGIQLFGDIPLYVALDSADVWANQGMFLLDEEGVPTLVGGVPPDYFCEDGQLWGNPVFNWEALEKADYNWWIARLYFNLHLFNLVRIDHFRGLESFWAVPADAETAKTGQWLPAKGFELMSIMQARLGKLPIIAEDLGIITPEVEQLRDHFTLPGMKVLQFAFSSDATNVHLPHNFINNIIAYTGTHDNDTLIGWWNSIDDAEREKATEYLGMTGGDIRQRLIEMVWASCAETAIIPMQDILALGTEARMNIPGTATGNWGWRYRKSQVGEECFEPIRQLNIRYNR